jgi:hypothetical protein
LEGSIVSLFFFTHFSEIAINEEEEYEEEEEKESKVCCYCGAPDSTKLDSYDDEFCNRCFNFSVEGCRCASNFNLTKLDSCDHEFCDRCLDFNVKDCVCCNEEKEEEEEEEEEEETEKTWFKVCVSCGASDSTLTKLDTCDHEFCDQCFDSNNAEDCLACKL